MARTESLLAELVKLWCRLCGDLDGQGSVVWRSYDTGSQFCPTQILLTNLQGVECGLAHGFIDVAGGDGDTVGRAHRIPTGVAL